VSPDAGPLDLEIPAVVKRLSRLDRDGREVIEHAAVIAEGAHSAAILRWLDDGGWEPEAAPARGGDRPAGLHAGRLASQRPQVPRRYVAPLRDATPSRRGQAS
jgi:hypothetical protein